MRPLVDKKEIEQKTGYPCVTFTGNPLVDSVFTYAMNKASGAGVVLAPEIWVDSRLDFPALELFVIIGNTIDNAIDVKLNFDEHLIATTIWINVLQNQRSFVFISMV